MGLMAALWWEWGDGPKPDLRPVNYVLVYQEPPAPGTNAVLSVELAWGLWSYTKTAPDRTAFDAEITVLNAASGFVVIFLCVAVGVGCGSICAVLADRLFRRRRKSSN